MPAETDFKKWFVHSNKSFSWLVQTIETSTGTGVPDIFICANGYSCWVELKATNSKTDCYMRISQWRWCRRLYRERGCAFLIIKRLKTRQIDVYSFNDLAEYLTEELTFKNEDVYFPADVRPVFSYKLGSGNKLFYTRFFETLEKTY